MGPSLRVPGALTGFLLVKQTAVHCRCAPCFMLDAHICPSLLSYRSLDISLEYSGPGGVKAARIYSMEVSASSAGGSSSK
jgi:hypothetical protein